MRAPQPEQWPNLPLEALGLNYVTVRWLKRHSVRCVGDLCRSAPEQLPGLDRHAPEMARKVLDALRARGLSMEGEAAPDPLGLPLLPGVAAAWADRPLAALEISPRLVGVLAGAGITTVGQLCAATPAQLLGLGSFGGGGLAEFRLAVVQCLNPPQGLMPRDEQVAVARLDEGRQHERPISALGLWSRVESTLAGLGVHTVEELCRRTEAELRQVDGLGPSSMRQITLSLARLQLSLAGPLSPVPGSATQGEPRSQKEWLDRLLAGCPAPRPIILMRRLGLMAGRALTPAEVGHLFHVGSHVVRDWEHEAREWVAGRATFVLRPINDLLVPVAYGAGGVAAVEVLADALTGAYPADGVDPVAFARFVLPYCRDLVLWVGELWGLRQLSEGPFEEAVAAMEAVLARENQRLPMQVLASQVPGDPRFLEACALRSPALRVSRRGEVHLAVWQRQDVLRSLFVAMLEIGRPAHYREIAEVMRRMLPEASYLSDEYVLALLQRRGRLVADRGGGVFVLKGGAGR